ncbi:MAG TPA: hypothetical protein DEB40_14440 [Elusimicrobia bacterium]|nr:hypothetical protein [Elusimicrobiota bacterium]HBT62932.1 hypothetical protein [Elusimicrobiota bacterium]
MKPAIYLLRDDDVHAADRGFKTVFELCMQEGIPVTYAAIPSRITPGLVEFLLRHKRHRRMFDIVQHGWTHANHNKASRWPRYEFGPLRSFAAQKLDMARGFKKLRAAFGPLFTPAFVPPFHQYDANTWRAAQVLEYRVFSAGPQKFPSPKTGCRYWHAHLGINEYDADYRSLPLSLPRLLRETARLIGTRPVVGAYFHHSTLDPANLGVFRDYLRVLRRLTDEGWIKPMTFSAWHKTVQQ